MQKVIIVLILSCIIVSTSVQAQCGKLTATNERLFINKMVQRYHFRRNYLIRLIKKVKFLPEVVEKIEQPYENKPWDVYQQTFITGERIRGGTIYWLHHQNTLTRAEKCFGVPSSVITAIIGIESLYGQNQGGFSVLNALSTLAFQYPPRAKFFQSELAQYLLLCRDLKINPQSICGSYAGAIGYPQFMPSSYRYYAVDFDHNHRTDLLHDTADVIGSVANFLKRAGWERNQIIAVPANVKGGGYKKLLNDKLEPIYTLNTLKKYGVTPAKPIGDNYKANLIQLKTANGYEYWLGLHNFYAITHYNTSVEYAMAVIQLALNIEASYKQY